MTADAAAGIRWNEAGLAPAVVQHHATGQVLMLGWMNREALRRTVESGAVHFWSRRRQEIWRKGETSGNTLALRSLRTDCDRDAILVRADPAGPTCHTGAVSCFFEPVAGGEASGGGDGPEATGGAARFGAVLDRLAAIVERRAEERPEGSYTASLLAAGPPRAAQKVGEEGVETALAAAAGSEEELVGEAADLLYHLLVALRSRGVPPGRVGAELERRFPSGPGETARPRDESPPPDADPNPA